MPTNPRGPGTRNTSLNLETRTKEKVKELAEYRDVSMNKLIVEWINEGLKRATEFVPVVFFAMGMGVVISGGLFGDSELRRGPRGARVRTASVRRARSWE